MKVKHDLGLNKALVFFLQTTNWMLELMLLELMSAIKLKQEIQFFFSVCYKPQIRNNVEFSLLFKRLKGRMSPSRSAPPLTQTRIQCNRRPSSPRAGRPPQSRALMPLPQVYTHGEHCIIRPIAASTRANTHQVAF